MADIINIYTRHVYQRSAMSRFFASYKYLYNFEYEYETTVLKFNSDSFVLRLQIEYEYNVDIKLITFKICLIHTPTDSDS